MCIRAKASNSPQRRAGGFTLLEVMLAVLIISLLVIAIHRFVRTNLIALNASTELILERQQVVGLMRYLESHLEEIPARRQGAIMGNAQRIRDRPSDEMDWICRAGPGVLTTAASDEYRVTLAIQPVEKRSSDLEIGLRRRPVDSEQKIYNWVSLLRPAAALEIRYYDPRVRAWVENWNDLNTRPALIRIRVWKTATGAPYESIIAIPTSRSQNTTS